MRSTLVILALGFALWRAYRSGNYFRVRWYLVSMFLTSIAQELYIQWNAKYILVGQEYLPINNPRIYPAYWIIYSVGTATILVNAWLVSMEEMLRNPLRKMLAWIPLATGAFIMAYFFWLEPVRMASAKLTAVQAGILAVAGLNIGLSVPLTLNFTEYIWGQGKPIQTLGRLFLVQFIMFCLLAAGWDLNPQGWGEIGGWLPSAVVIAFMLKLGYGLRPLSQVPVHVRSRG